MIIGITGGTGCGKTTALEVIRDLSVSCWTATPSTTSCLKPTPRC